MASNKFELYVCGGTPGLKGAERTNPDTSNRQEATHVSGGTDLTCAPLNKHGYKMFGVSLAVSLS